MIDTFLEKIGNVRVYKKDEIPEDTIKEILEVTRKTPSMANVQPWEIILITDPERKEKLANCTLDPLLREHGTSKQWWLKDAPLIILFCIDLKRAKAKFGEIGEIFAIQDVAVLIHNMRLKAVEKGLASCWVREIDIQKIREVFNLPWYIKPINVLTVGYPLDDLKKQSKPSLELDEFTYLNTWGSHYGIL